MNKVERIDKTLGMLRHEIGLPIQTIADNLKVSHMTVRRDLAEMASHGIVRLIHGGAILSPTLAGERTQRPYSLNIAEGERSAAKRRIGVRAAELISDNDILIIDNGSTTECLARSVPQDKDLTILSYALNIISETARLPRVRSMFCGGTLHSNTLMFESPEGLTMLERFRATKAFISAAGVTHDFGVTCPNDYERQTKKVAIQSSVKKILVTDSSKFGRIHSSFFADLREFDTVVTDDELPEEYAYIIRDLGLELILA